MTEQAPDHDIEQFWLSFKQSMNNFYSVSNYKILYRPIERWSNQLNVYQSEKKYIEIEEAIMQYITLYAMDLLKSCNTYYIDILRSNIKRWNKISEKYKCQFGENDDKKTYYNCIFMLIDICPLVIEGEDLKFLLSEYELYILNHDYSSLIHYALEHNKIGMLDKLLKYDYYGTLSVIGITDEDTQHNKWSAKKLISKKIEMLI